MEPLSSQQLFSTYTVIFPLLLICLLTVLHTHLSSSRRRLRLPPIPNGSLPLLGHLHLLGPLPHRAFHRLAVRHGPLISVRLGSVICIVASSADAARDVLKTNEASFLDRPPSKAVRHLTYGGANFAFSPYSAYWRFMKKVCVSELLGSRTLDRLRHIRREEVEGFVRFLQEKAKAGEEVNMGAMLMGMSSDIAMRMAMGKRWSGNEKEAEEGREVVKAIATLVATFNLADYIGVCKNLDLQRLNKRFEAEHRRFDRVMERILKEKEDVRKKAGGGGGGGEKDLLDMLMDLYEDDEAEMRITRENIKAFMMVPSVYFHAYMYMFLVELLVHPLLHSN